MERFDVIAKGKRWSQGAQRPPLTTLLNLSRSILLQHYPLDNPSFQLQELYDWCSHRKVVVLHLPQFRAIPSFLPSQLQPLAAIAYSSLPLLYFRCFSSVLHNRYKPQLYAIIFHLYPHTLQIDTFLSETDVPSCFSL